MYVLDTNVVSETRKLRTARIDPGVTKWFESIRASDLFIASVTLMELEIGVLLLERRDAAQGRGLRAWFETSVLGAFAGHVLPLDQGAARICARLNVPDPKPRTDIIIAATAISHDMVVVTRNVDDFRSSGVRILNPWGTTV